MDGIPATLANEDDVPEVLVVGSVNAEGKDISSFSNMDSDKGLPHVYSVGENLKCPIGHDTFYTASGTSGGM